MVNGSQLEEEMIPSNVRFLLLSPSILDADSCCVVRLIVWDVKSLKKPLFTATNLPTLNPETNIIFSPDDKYLLTGTAGAHAGVLVGTAEQQRASKAKGAQSGKVVVLKVEGLEVIRELSGSLSLAVHVQVQNSQLTIFDSIDISSFSVVRVLWHPKINQVCSLLSTYKLST
jgi:hypothetical protein